MRENRVEFRTNELEKRQFEEAASILGVNLYSFLRNIALERSVEILKGRDSILLSNKDRDAFLTALENPPQPNKDLKKAYQKYKQFVKCE
jgi:uncharacterized protein (DUF1778 family)